MAQIKLSADEEAVKRAERAAAARNTTVNSMLVTALETIGELDFDAETLPPITRQALGIAGEIPNRPYKELLVEALSNKYGAEKPATEVEFDTAGGVLTIGRKQRQRPTYTLVELLSQAKRPNPHRELMNDAPRGPETL